MRLNAQEIAVVRSSIQLLCRNRTAAAETFYRHLFTIAPTSRNLFVTDLDRQGAKLVATLEVVADQIDKWGLLRPSVEDLALRHTAYGVVPEDYTAAGDALLATLAEHLGSDWTPEAELIWRRVYATIEDAMIRAGYRQDMETGRL
jgi:nitric oxide dioxygenase